MCVPVQGPAHVHVCTQHINVSVGGLVLLVKKGKREDEKQVTSTAPTRLLISTFTLTRETVSIMLFKYISVLFF